MKNNSKPKQSNIMKLIKIFSFCILISSILVNCVSKGDKHQNDYNGNKAIRLYNNEFIFLLSGRDESYYLNKLIIIDSCIFLDPNIGDFYRTKAYILKRLFKYTEALVNINIALKLNSNDNYSWMAKGEIYERLGDIDSARIFYLEAYRLADSIVKSKPGNLFSSFSHKMFIMCLLGLKDNAVSEINEFRIKHKTPFAKDTNFFNDIFNFDRQKYFKSNYP